MRLLNELPEIESKIENGNLSLSVIAEAQSYFRHKRVVESPVSRENKLDLLIQLEGTSRGEAESIIVKLAPEIVRNDRIRPLTEELFEIRISVTKSFIEKLNRLKNIYSHMIPTGETKVVLERVMDVELKRHEAKSPNADRNLKTPTSSRYIEKDARRQILEKSHHQCQFVSPETGRRRSLFEACIRHAGVANKQSVGHCPNVDATNPYFETTNK